VLAIALAVVITVLVVRPADGGGGNGDPTQQNGDSEFASADDTGPVNIITEDPTCAAWGKVAREYSQRTKNVKWGERDDSIPADGWNSEQRAMYQTVAEAMESAADRTGNLMRQTPHRAMRELYGQFIQYARAFSEKVPSYTADDGDLAVVTDTLVTATASVCSAIDYGSAIAVAPLVQGASPPSNSVGIDASVEKMFLSSANEVCSEWDALTQSFDDETRAWQAIDAKIPASEWTPEQKATNDAIGPIMSANADKLEDMGRRSGNAILEDFATLAGQYRRAYVAALPTYTANDNFLSQTATQLVRTINWACKAAAT
jgi:hypothetical protein